MRRPLRRQDASRYLEEHGIRRKPATLAKLACVGGGPQFILDGRIPLYPPELLDAWAESILTPPAATTAEHGVRHRGHRRKQAEALHGPAAGAVSPSAATAEMGARGP